MRLIYIVDVRARERINEKREQKKADIKERD